MNLVNGGIVGVGLLNIRKNLKFYFKISIMDRKWVETGPEVGQLGPEIDKNWLTLPF